jgi:predicted peroxiredoxin
MATNRKAKKNQTGNAQDMSSIVQKINETRFAIEQYKAENPGIDVEALLSEQKDLLPILGLLPNRELDKFINHAKEQGTKMSFHEMEMGVLAAGREDMQNGLAEIVNSLKFEKCVCSECNTEMENRGRSEKKL